MIKLCGLIFSGIFLILVNSVSAEEDVCLFCHSQFMGTARVIHPAMNAGCGVCHKTAEGMSHPQQKGSMRLIQDVPALCYGCHDKSRFSDRFVHAPVKEGLCPACHNPHQSDVSRLLVSAKPGLCYKCHEDKTTKKNIHAPAVKVDCLYCHTSHASNSTSLLTRNLLHVNDLCVRCHKKQARGRHLLGGLRGNHPMWKVPDPSRPGREITCASCHDPHGSDFPKLAPSAGLCGRCHKY